VQDSQPHETETLCAVAQEIVTYKQMFATGLTRLTAAAKEQQSANLLAEIAANERQDVDLWAKQLTQLNGRSYSGRWLGVRVRLMMALLGARGFLEWALIAEDDTLNTLSLQVANMSDPETAAAWTRFVNDEYLHVVRMKEGILGMESWEMSGGGGVRDAIFGANDGLVSILALVAGVFGAVTDSHLVLVAGLAGAVAGTVSMGAGAYVSSKSEQEVTQKEQQRKQRGTQIDSANSAADLALFYIEQGYEQSTAQAIADRVSQRLEVEKTFDIGAETGLADESDWPPVKVGLLTGLSFLIASLVPILPFTFLDVYPAAILAIVASIVAMFLIGASKAIFTRQSFWRSGLEVMVIGILASVATYIIGILIPI